MKPETSGGYTLENRQEIDVAQWAVANYGKRTDEYADVPQTDDTTTSNVVLGPIAGTLVLDVLQQANDADVLPDAHRETARSMLFTAGRIEVIRQPHWLRCTGSFLLHLALPPQSPR